MDTEEVDLSAYAEIVASDDLGPEARKLFDHLTSRVIGQDRAARKIARGFAVHHAGLSEPNKPIGSFFFSGPTGWGKTEMANQVGYYLIGDTPKPPVTSIQCAFLKKDHEISKIIGAPPGYVGYGQPYLLSQLKIDEPHFWAKIKPYMQEAFEDAGPDADPEEVLSMLYEEHKPYNSVIVFNEFEKAHTALQEAMLHIVDEAVLQGGDGAETSFQNSTIILTCNVNGKQQQDLIAGKDESVGFKSKDQRRKHVDEMSESERDELDNAIYTRTKHEIGKIFTPEFVGRFSENIVVFRTLQRSQQMVILENMLAKLRNRFTVAANAKREDGKRCPIFFLTFSQRFKEYVLHEGVNMRHGVRKLGAAVQRLATSPVANAILGGGITDGDDVLVDFFEGKVQVRKRPVTKTIHQLPPPKIVGTPEKDE